MNTEEAAAPSTPPPPGLAERLGNVRLGVRRDLEVSRHLFRGVPAYVVRDPLTLQSHRLGLADYTIFVALDASRPLGSIFAEQVEAGRLVAGDAERFYEFILSLHRLNFLNLPVSDEKLLYQRYRQRLVARRREKMLGFLFLRVPLWNPDSFLSSTLPAVRFVFGRAFFAGWLLLMATAAFVAVQNWSVLRQPAEGLLAARNLPLIWLTLIVLKAMHEMGHAYACRHFGGYVPEMGAFFIIFTPCAYVDATACWGFPRRRERLIVCLAGMYIESIAAALALFVWAGTSTGMLHDLACNVVFLAGVMTVLFNINPLMRYDGYYALTDWLEIPNLRQRSTQYVVNLLKHSVLGLRGVTASVGLRLGLILAAFGVAATIYRVLLVLGICALLAGKFFLVGAGLALFFLASTLAGTSRRLIRYLWSAPETAPVRWRARTVALLVLLGGPAALLTLPIRANTQAAGLAGMSSETLVRCSVDGVLTATELRAGQAARAGDLLADLRNEAYAEQVAVAAARLQAATIRAQAYETTNPIRAQDERAQAEVARRELATRTAEAEQLAVRAPMDGTVVHVLQETDIGRYLPRGEPVALLVAGRPQIRVLLSAEELAQVRPQARQPVEVRTAACPALVARGRVAHVQPAGTRNIHLPALTHLAGGNIVIDPLSQSARQPYFEVLIEIVGQDEDWARRAGFNYGSTCHVRFPAQSDTIASMLWRRLARFANTMRQA